MRNHTTVLDVEVDTGAFESGTYSLAIRQLGWRVGIDMLSACSSYSVVVSHGRARRERSL